MKKQFLFSTILIVLVFFISGCLAGPNSVVNIPAPGGELAGFWMGLWHGVIAPFTFIMSLLTDNIQMYEVHNNGGWYNFGFVIGAGILFGGGHKASKKRRR